MKSNYITDYGGKGKVVILLHGFVSSSKYWNGIQPRLTRMGYRVITIDLLGFGHAPKPKDSDYSYDEHIAHISDAVASLKLRRPFVIVGHSLGALLAARYARQHERSVESLVLLHPPIYRDREQVRATLRSTGRFYRALLDSRFRNYIWIIMRNLGPIGKHISHSRERTLANVIEKAELLQDLTAINTRTLMLVGTKDRKEYMANLAQGSVKPNVSIVIENIGHHSPRIRPNLVMKHLLAFLSTPTSQQVEDRKH
jgi:pimeloyl-ACP methyl ester carboxylesterase